MDIAKIKSLATLKNAKEWQETSERFTYCIDLLDISAHDNDSDEKVYFLEKLFVQALWEDYEEKVLTSRLHKQLKANLEKE